MKQRPPTGPSAGRALEPLPTLATALGRKLRQRRTEWGRTAEDVARYARALGLSWDRSTVASIETGRRNVAAAELLLLPVIYDRPLADLLPDERVRLADQVAASPAGLRHALTNAPELEGDEWWTPGELDFTQDSPSLLRKGLGVWEEAVMRFPQAAFGTLRRAEQHAHDEVTSKAARRLGTDRRVIAVGAEQLWGQGLAMERDRRITEQSKALSPRALQAARGHVTRQLVQELEHFLDAHPYKADGRG